MTASAFSDWTKDWGVSHPLTPGISCLHMTPTNRLLPEGTGILTQFYRYLSYIQYMPYTLALFSAEELLTDLKNTSRSEFLSNNLGICCLTEKF